MDPQVFQASLVFLVLKEIVEHKELRETQVNRVALEKRDLVVRMAGLVLMEHLVLKAPEDDQGNQGKQEVKDQLDPQVHQA